MQWSGHRLKLDWNSPTESDLEKVKFEAVCGFQKVKVIDLEVYLESSQADAM